MVHVFKTEKYENNFTMKCFDWHVTWYLLTSYQPDPTALINLYYICFRIAIFLNLFLSQNIKSVFVHP